MTFIIKIDGKIVKGFDGPPKGQSGNMQGWYTQTNNALGTVEYTSDLIDAYLVEGRINMQSAFERIVSRMREQGLRFSRLEFVEVENNG